ncbi:MAG: hypothetical protein R3E66_18245 [bacterium]
MLTQNADDKISAEVFEVVEQSSRLLQCLAECMRSEREHVTFFNVAALMKVLEEKNRLLDLYQHHAQRQREAVSGEWTRWMAGQSMPEDLVEALSALGKTVGGQDGVRLEDLSSELHALRDVVAELHAMNRNLLDRAVGWITSYVAELVDSNTNQTYGVSGRIGRPAMSNPLLSRTI